MKTLLFFPLAILICTFGCNTPAKSTEGDQKQDTTATSEAPMTADLQETYWKVIELNGQPVVNPPSNQKEAHIILKKEENRLQGNGGCNNLMGTYELMDGNRIKFSGVASTMMACPDMTIESQLGKAIEMADNYTINGKFLMLHKAKMAPLARFEAKP